MSLHNFIKYLVYKWQERKIKRLVTVYGTHHDFGPTAHINLADKSDKSDIVIDDYVGLFGTLTSQNHGKIFIGKFVNIGRNVKITSVESVTIGDEVIISELSVISDSNNHPLSPLFRRVRARLYRNLMSEMHFGRFASHKPVVIKDNVWICERVRVCKGVTIGKNCVIGANSIVTKDIPDNCIAVGNPAKVVKTDIDKLPNPTDCKEFNEFIAKYGTDF